jgi:hypothetical protein
VKDECFIDFVRLTLLERKDCIMFFETHFYPIKDVVRFFKFIKIRHSNFLFENKDEQALFVVFGYENLNSEFLIAYTINLWIEMPIPKIVLL